MNLALAADFEEAAGDSSLAGGNRREADLQTGGNSLLVAEEVQAASKILARAAADPNLVPAAER
jgi:hypothetical protein